MKCFYHNDLDGHASAFCVHAWVGIKSTIVSRIGDFRSINYDKPFPLEDILPGEQVWIVDFSIKPEEMRQLLAITEDVTWIDHHKTAIEKYADFEIPIRGIRKDGIAACELTWKYIHWWTNRGDGEEDFTRDRSDTYPVPRCIQLTGDRDVWKWEFGDETKHFYSGTQLHKTEPDSDFWWKCMDHEIKDLPPPNTGNKTARIRGEKWWAQLLHDGETIEKYKTQFYEGYAADLGYEVEFEGHKCFAVNVARISSDVLGDRINQYDFLIAYYHNGTKWIVSLYSAEVDVSGFAVSRGGGGHKNACGFSCDELPFKPREEK